MEEGRTSRISKRLPWLALMWLVLGLAGVSAAAGGNGSLCEERPTNDDCGSAQSGCCCEVGDLPGQPIKTRAGMVLPGAPTIPQITADIKVSAGAVEITINLRGQRSRDYLIPPELRLGSALWSHAPPTRAA